MGIEATVVLKLFDEIKYTVIRVSILNLYSHGELLKGAECSHDAHAITEW